MATFFVRATPAKQGPRLTGRGFAFLGVCVLCLIFGTVFKELVLIQLVGFGLLVLLISWGLAAYNLKGLEISRITPSHVFAFQDFVIDVRLENKKRWMDSFWLSLEDSLLPYSDRGLMAPWVRASGFCRMEFHSRLVKRGVMEQASVICTSTFPFGLFKVYEKRRLPVNITVFPKPVTPRALEHDYESDYLAGEHEGLLVRDVSGDFHGIREFQPGDPMKSIHWQATARYGKPMVRELDRPIPERYSIVFHSYSPPSSLIWPESFETAMELLAGLLFYCQRRGVPLDLTASFYGWKTVQIPDPNDLTVPLTILAQASQESTTTLHDLTNALRTLPGDHSVFVFSETPIKLWAHLLPSLPRHVTCLDNARVQLRPPIFKAS